MGIFVVLLFRQKKKANDKIINEIRSWLATVRASNVIT